MQQNANAALLDIVSLINHTNIVIFLILIIKNMKVYIIWLIGVILWNFGYPEATPMEDVVVAILLSLLSYFLKQKVKFLN